ncbi:hypothetical protein [Brevundimonas sp.]|uniref:hypothetical protein n=1 Tax=Brevundimonas sp. TaxID=1871086 RepID=UPI003F6F34C3
MKLFRTFLLALFVSAVAFAFPPVQAALPQVVEITQTALMAVAGGSLTVWALTHLLASLGNPAVVQLSALPRFAAPQTGTPQATAFA